MRENLSALHASPGAPTLTKEAEYIDQLELTTLEMKKKSMCRNATIGLLYPVISIGRGIANNPGQPLGHRHASMHTMSSVRLPPPCRIESPVTKSHDSRRLSWYHAGAFVAVYRTPSKQQHFPDTRIVKDQCSLSDIVDRTNTLLYQSCRYEVFTDRLSHSTANSAPAVLKS